MSRYNLYRKIVTYILCFTMFFLFPTASYADVTYSNENHIITFAYFNEIVIPANHTVTVNVSDYYTTNSDGSQTINKINVFVKTDQSPIGYWQVEDINANYVQVDSTQYSSLTYDGNVLVSPSWIWTNKYKSLSIWKAKNTTYTVAGAGSVLLSQDCMPAAHNDIVTTFTVETN